MKKTTTPGRSTTKNRISRSKKPGTADRRFRFVSCESEGRAIEKFRKQHFKRCGAAKSTPVEIRLVPTGIGISVSVACLRCGAIRDVTDFDSW